jgi:3-hydroxyacyl-[acyl-carrier-protein] dehydratase
MSDQPETHTVNILDIKRMIPHRYPFLMIDKVRDIVLNTSAVGIKNVTINEPFFEGHFPQSPVMPGVLIVEAMAQTAAVMVIKTIDAMDSDMLVYFMGIDATKFRKPVTPGDQLELHVEVIRGRGKVWKFRGVGKVDGAVVAEAEFTAMMVPPENG